MEEKPPRVKDILPEALYVHSVIIWSCCNGIDMKVEERNDLTAEDIREHILFGRFNARMNYANPVDSFSYTGGNKSL